MEQPRVFLSRTSAMRALIVDPKLTYQADYLSPTLTPGESVIRVSLAGICGTDLEITRGYMGFRGVPGHEFVGCVVETTDPRLSGNRVVGEINVACAGCSFCRIGLGRHCPDRTVLGIVGRDGAFAEYLKLPNENLLIVPDSIPDESAVFTEPLAAAYEIFEQLHIARNRSVVVLGDGRLGAIVALALRAEGYRPTIAGHHREKLERLASLGVSTTMEQDLNEKVDYVIDCTGRGDGLQRAVELVKPCGTIVLKSTAAAGAALNLAPVVINEISVVGSRCGRFAPALDALDSGAVDPRPLLDGIYSLEEGFIAMEAARRPSSFKILLKP